MCLIDFREVERDAGEEREGKREREREEEEIQSYLQVGHDIEIISHDELNPVCNSVYLSIADCTSDLHRVYVDCYH